MSKIFLILIILVTFARGQIDTGFESYLQELNAYFEIEQIEIDSLNTQAVILLDTREIEEYTISRIESAIWVGYNDFDLSRLEGIDQEDQIVVYCSVGYRSSKIGMVLKEHGYKNVKNLYGGIFKWANEGLPLYKNTIQTWQIHTYDKHWRGFIHNPALIKID